MDLMHAMRTFVRVVDAGSFTAAAEQCGMSTAQVSRLVSELENHLQARLLHRTTRRLALSEAGSRYVERCRQILAQLEQAELEAGCARIEPRGRLRVHSITGLGIQLLAPLAGRYAERYPEVELDLTLSQHRPDLLQDGLDVVITLRHELQDSELIAQRLGDVVQVLCAAPAYLARYGVPREPSELAAHRCLRLADRRWATPGIFSARTASGCSSLASASRSMSPKPWSTRRRPAWASASCLITWPRPLCNAAAWFACCPSTACRPRRSMRCTRHGAFSMRRSRPGSTSSARRCPRRCRPTTACSKTGRTGPIVTSHAKVLEPARGFSAPRRALSYPA